MLNTNKLALIDLSPFKVQIITINEKIRRLFLGGRGINMLLLYHLTKPETDPLSPHNPLIVGAGLLSGMKGPATSRCSISGKSPETGLLGDSNIGGYFSATLRKTGFDHLVIRGKAQKPVYLMLKNGDIEIHDASSVWGLDTIETMHYFKKLYGPSSEALCIGQAGENLVRFSGVRNGLKSMAGRTGMGCLMGWKKLKAIVAIGEPSSSFLNPQDDKVFTDYVREVNKKLMESKTREALHTYGTAFLYDIHNFLGVIRTHNGQLSKFEDGRYLRSGYLKKNYYVKSSGCFSCPISCRHQYELKSGKEGEEKIIYGEGPEYGLLAAFGPICGLKDPETILIINDLLNRYGIDCCSCGNIIAWAMELFQRGIITKQDTGDLSLTWGNARVVIELIHQIAHQKGFGGVLAKGAKEASLIIGRESRKYLIWSKYLLQSDSADVRAFKGFALGVATASRGADHLRSRPTMEALNLSDETLKKIYGADISSDPASYQGKAAMVFWSEINYSIADALGICRFAQNFNNVNHLGLEEFSRLIFYATGLDLSIDDLVRIGERIITLERMFLGREGVDRQWDTLADRYFEEPIPSGKFKGEKIEKKAFRTMLDDYYDLHLWDKESGTPSKERIHSLGLDLGLEDIFDQRIS